MKNCFSRFRFISLFAAIIVMASCTDIDNRLGSDLIPIDQTLKLRVASLSGGMDTYTVKTDSLPSNNPGYLMFGKRYNEKFGQTVASTFTYFIPDAFYDEEEYFGYNPVIDSVTIVLSIFDVSVATIDGVLTEHTEEQEFGIFQATKVLSVDSLYYSTIDPSTFIGSEPIFTFKHSGTLKTSILKTLAVTPKGKIFLDEILATTPEVFNTDTLFLKRFKGLYIAPMNQDKEDAVIYYSNTRTDPNSDVSASINLHYHNYDKDKPIAPAYVKDTLTQRFSLTDAPTYGKLAFGVVKHDYVGSEVESYISKSVSDTIEGAPGNKRVFIQNMAGINSFVRFSEEFCEKINSYKLHEGVQYKKIMINRAILSFGVQSASNVDILNSATSRLGMYYTYKSFFPEMSPDYDYEMEASDYYPVTFNGYLNRVKGAYEMNVTSYIQQLILNAENAKLYPEVRRGVFIAPSYGLEAFYNYSQVELIGSASSVPDDNINSLAPKLELTFTLIK